jgi:hypothetical protein
MAAKWYMVNCDEPAHYLCSTLRIPTLHALKSVNTFLFAATISPKPDVTTESATQPSQTSTTTEESEKSGSTDNAKVVNGINVV